MRSLEEIIKRNADEDCQGIAIDNSDFVNSFTDFIERQQRPVAKDFVVTRLAPDSVKVEYRGLKYIININPKDDRALCLFWKCNVPEAAKFAVETIASQYRRMTTQ